MPDSGGVTLPQNWTLFGVPFRFEFSIEPPSEWPQNFGPFPINLAIERRDGAFYLIVYPPAQPRPCPMCGFPEESWRP